MKYKSFMESLNGKLTEATVETKKYSWGTMKTVHHGKDFSVPLHPEHHQAIAKLKDEQEHKFKDETGRHWTARRKGNDVHFHSGNDGPKTVVKHSDLKEETELKEVDRIARADYKVTPSGRKTHREIIFSNSSNDQEEDDDEEDKMKKEESELDEALDPSEIASNPRMYSADDAKKAYYHKKASDSDKETLAKHLDRHHGNKNWRKPVKEEAEQVDEAMSPQQKSDFDRMMAGAMSRAAYNAKWKKPLKSDSKVIYGKNVKEEAETTEKAEMALTQLHFINYASEEIMDYIEMGGDVEEWYQNKLSKVHSDMESLHSYMEGEKRRTGMVKEDAEQIDERNKENALKRKSMDASRGARFKVQGNAVPDPEPEHKTTQAHNKAIGRAIRKMSREEVEFEEQAPVAPSLDKKYIKGTPEHKAYMATKKTRVGHPTGIKEDLDEKLDLTKSKMGDVIKDFQASDAPQFAGKSKEKRREMAIAAKLEADRGIKEGAPMSYKEFMMMLEYEARGGVYRHSGTYGYDYDKKEREQDEKGFDSEKQSTEKRGRGRPAGAKSGARGPKFK